MISAREAREAQLPFQSLGGQLKSGDPAPQIRSTPSGMLEELREDHDLNLNAPRAVLVANDPPLILADKPTINLDDNNPRNVMMLLLRNSCRERGKTLIVAAHDNNAMHAPDATFEMRADTLTMSGDQKLPLRWGQPPMNDGSLPCSG